MRYIQAAPLLLVACHVKALGTSESYPDDEARAPTRSPLSLR